jgi:hypothetical protein
MLCSTPVDRYVPSASNPSVGRRSAPGPEAEQDLKGSTTIVPKHELVQIDLKLRFTDAVVRADQPLLHVANGAVASSMTEGAPLRRSLLRGCVRATCSTPAALKSSKPFRPSV